MIKWTALPFFRFAIAMTGGILFYIHSGIHLPYFYLLSTFTLFYLLVFLISYKKNFRYKLSPVLGIFGLSIVFFFGATLTELKDEINNKEHILNASSSYSYYEAVVTSDIEEKNNSFKTEISIQKIKTKEGWRNISGNILLYFKKNTRLQYGDHILVKGTPQLISPPANPGEFDYKEYLRFHRIYHSHFIKENEVLVIGHTPPSHIMETAIFIRKKCDLVFRNNIKGESEYKIASALFLGIKNNLDNTLKQAYSATGTMHVLAVSGLHVAIILQMLMLVFGFLEKSKGGKIILPIILILMLWLYAFITGLSASVLRAAVMFTFLIIAKSINRKTNPYNTLAVTAFALLCYDPFFIMDVGFQLSFLAILGIIYFYPVFYTKVEFKNFIADKTWAVTCVSLAAQVSTFPLTVFYFHQFPVYFLISNLIVIPVSFFILYAGALLLCTYWIPFFAPAIAWILQKAIWLMNEAVFICERIPGALIDGIDIDAAGMAMIYLIITGISMFIYFQKLAYLNFSYFILLLFCVLQIQEIKNQQGQRKFIVYNIKDHIALGFIKGNSIDLVIDASLMKDEANLKYHIFPHLCNNGIKNINIINSMDFKNISLPYYHANDYTMIVFEKKKFLILHKDHTPSFKTRIKTDFIIANNIKNPEKIPDEFDFGKLIIHTGKKYRNITPANNTIINKAFEINL